MDLDHGLGGDVRHGGLDFEKPAGDVKSPLRMRYDAEIRLIRAQHGGLEEIRAQLGLSRRKICQLLMVDPSAWTRWVRDESKVPPHVFRALEWFLALNQKAFTDPGIAAYLQRRFDAGKNPGQGDIEALRAECARLAGRLRDQGRVTMLLMAAIAVLAASLIFTAF